MENKITGNFRKSTVPQIFSSSQLTQAMNKTQNHQTPQDCKGLSFCSCLVVPEQLREVRYYLNSEALVSNLLSVCSSCPLLRILWKVNEKKVLIVSNICTGKFLGVHNLGKMEIAYPGHAGSHLFLTYGKDLAVYFRLKIVSRNKI